MGWNIMFYPNFFFWRRVQSKKIVFSDIELRLNILTVWMKGGKISILTAFWKENPIFSALLFRCHDFCYDSLCNMWSFMHVYFSRQCLTELSRWTFSAHSINIYFILNGTWIDDCPSYDLKITSSSLLNFCE